MPVVTWPGFRWTHGQAGVRSKTPQTGLLKSSKGTETAGRLKVQEHAMVNTGAFRNITETVKNGNRKIGKSSKHRQNKYG